jgi:GT-D fold-like domain
VTDPPAVPENGSLNLSRRQAVRRIRCWIGEAAPAAVVRMGEGEGRLLAADPDDARSMDIAIRKLRRQTGLTFSRKEMLKVKALVMNALEEADVLGLRVSASFSDEHKEWGERIAQAYADRVAQGRKPAYVTHCLLNSDLFKALPMLLEERRQVSVISCRDVKTTLEEDYGARDVGVYQVPSQYVVRDVDGSYEAALHDVPIWPDFYRKLREQIAVRDRGEVFLVGAGVFGKDLCIRVRDLGGIALDMGSTLDKMASKVTRGKRRPPFRPFPKTPKLV